MHTFESYKSSLFTDNYSLECRRTAAIAFGPALCVDSLWVFGRSSSGDLDAFREVALAICNVAPFTDLHLWRKGTLWVHLRSGG